MRKFDLVLIRFANKQGVPANNCFYKGIELIQRLGALGYSVRGRVGETFWDGKLFPKEIVTLYPIQFLVTHFYVEAEIDGLWRILDPSFDPALGKASFRIAEWNGENAPCFEITKRYSQKEQTEYQVLWNAPEYAESYFGQAGPFLKRLNAWLETIRRNQME